MSRRLAIVVLVGGVLAGCAASEPCAVHDSACHQRAAAAAAYQHCIHYWTFDRQQPLDVARFNCSRH